MELVIPWKSHKWCITQNILILDIQTTDWLFWIFSDVKLNGVRWFRPILQIHTYPTLDLY